MGMIKSIFNAIAKAPKVATKGLSALANTAESFASSTDRLRIRTTAMAADEQLDAEIRLFALGRSSLSACQNKLAILNIALDELETISSDPELAAIREQRRKREAEVRNIG
ncbi:MAG: hypothetical protein P1U78_04880 [Alcanivoracaceae bacterium]|nr:hypothetical protein [Alcanivoracaceae bacterium]